MNAENRLTLPSRSYDVVVAGGGVAGIAAALASARHGASTLLIEKEYCLGGLATLGLIVVYLALDDGGGVQMSGGICEELAKLTYKYGPADKPECWINPGGDREERKKRRYEVRYNAAPFMIAAEELLLAEGVKILYDCRVTGANTADGRVTSVELATKRGFLEVKAGAFVDATGDADVCYFAGEPTVDCAENRRTGWYYSAKTDGSPVQLHVHTVPMYGELPAGSPLFSGTDPDSLAAHMADMRGYIMEDVRERNNRGEGIFPIAIPAFHGLRTTRRLKGAFELSADLHERVWFTDAIGMVGDWRKRGPRYSIPYRAIRAVKYSNLFAAGRAAAADKSGWELTRVIPACAVTGEAAGIAAAISVTIGSNADVQAVQDDLRRNGVLLDESLFDRVMEP